MDESTLDHIKQIVDLRGPNIWLELEAVSLKRFFDVSIDRGDDLQLAKISAKAFAERENYTVSWETDRRVVRFGRAYF